MNMRFAAPLVLAMALGACASTSGNYPSLAIRDIERYYGSAEPIAPASEPAAPVAPSAELSQRLAQLQSQAAAAHQAFLSALPGTAEIMAEGRDAEIASDRWIEAQAALAGLEANRSRAMTALADLDALFIAAQTEGGAKEAIAEVQKAVESLIDEEDTHIDGLYGHTPAKPFP